MAPWDGRTLMKWGGKDTEGSNSKVGGVISGSLHLDRSSVEPKRANIKLGASVLTNHYFRLGEELLPRCFSRSTALAASLAMSI